MLPPPSKLGSFFNDISRPVLPSTVSLLSAEPVPHASLIKSSPVRIFGSTSVVWATAAPCQSAITIAAAMDFRNIHVSSQHFAESVFLADPVHPPLGCLPRLI